MANTIRFKVEIDPDRHHEGKYNITVNNACYSRSDEYVKSLHSALAALLTVAAVYPSDDQTYTGSESVPPGSAVNEILDELDKCEIDAIAELEQVVVKRDKLVDLLNRWNDGLAFVPKSPKCVYEMRLKALNDYINTLQIQIAVENA